MLYTERRFKSRRSKNLQPRGPSIRFFELVSLVEAVELLLEDVVPECACGGEELIDQKRVAQALLAALVLDDTDVVIKAVALESCFNAQEISL